MNNGNRSLEILDQLVKRKEIPYHKAQSTGPKRPRPQNSSTGGPHKSGRVTAEKLVLCDEIRTGLQQSYIAFDVETTGLSAARDRIIELGAVRFENGIAVDRYETLVRVDIPVPPAATRVNHITNAMLHKAPAEEDVYRELTAFLDSAMTGQTAICAHNASFDMRFLSAALTRTGYDAAIKYIDTLSLSRKLIRNLENYKQDTVAGYFKVENRASHRAGSDAEVCGCILRELLAL